MKKTPLATQWVCYFYFVGWWNFSFGIHFDLSSLNMEIHLPCGFIRVGRQIHYLYSNDFKNILFGYKSDWKDVLIKKTK